MASLPDRAATLDGKVAVIREALSKGESVSFIPGGTSMKPMLYPGRDIVVLSQLPDKLRKYDLPLYQRHDGQYVLHRIVRVGETYTCMGDNQFFREKNLTHSQMIGLVTAFVRNGKKRCVSAFGYRLYCRIWYYSRFPRRCWRKLRRILTGGKKV